MTIVTDALIVRDIMVKNVRSVFADAPAVRAAQVMGRSHIRHLPVIDVDGKVIGVLSQRDLLKHLSPWLTQFGPAPEDAPRCESRELMSTPPITVKSDAPIQEAAAILASRKIGCLPVLDDTGYLVGILSTVDLLRHAAWKEMPTGRDDFKPFMPAARICDSGNISVPKEYCAGLKFDTAVLSYAAASKRIRVKLFLKGTDDQSLHGARAVTLTDDYVVIPADDFLDYHRIGFRGNLDVTEDPKGDCFILSRRLAAVELPRARARRHSR